MRTLSCSPSAQRGGTLGPGEPATSMRRRELLGSLVGSVGSLTGCSGRPRLSGSGSAATIENVTGADGRPGDICSREPQPDRIPAIVEPAFARDWSGIASDLRGDATGVGLKRDDEARAYPLSVLRFEIVNDRFEDPVMVTYCPLCSSGLAAKRTVDGRETVFGNTSYTWRPPRNPGQTAIENDRVFGLSSRGHIEPTNDPNLVMFDEATGSYWSQLLAQAICGPLTGCRLELLPSTVTTWTEWRSNHEKTAVLLPPPHSRTMGD